MHLLTSFLENLNINLTFNINDIRLGERTCFYDLFVFTWRHEQLLQGLWCPQWLKVKHQDIWVDLVDQCEAIGTQTNEKMRSNTTWNEGIGNKRPERERVTSQTPPPKPHSNEPKVVAMPVFSMADDEYTYIYNYMLIQHFFLYCYLC